MIARRRRTLAVALALAVGLAVSALPAAAESDDPPVRDPALGERLEDLGTLLREKLEELRDDLGRVARELEDRLRKRGDREPVDGRREPDRPVEI
jgi:hypothetical protein